MKRKESGITLIEIMTVVAIIVLLGGFLIPTLTLVRKTANITKQRAELNTMELAITTFKNDYGDYPPSDYGTIPNGYGGAQKLAEALCGWDLLGFHPNSHWRSDGQDGAGNLVYDPNTTNPVNLRARRGPYLDMTSISVFKVGDPSNDPGLFKTYNSLAPGTYVICDIFGVRNISSGSRIVKAGTPILYFKANPASKDHRTTATNANRIYNVDDNKDLIALKTLTPDGSASSKDHFRGGGTTYSDGNFYDFITDSRVPMPNGWPYNPDSYILISAGPDGEYGTQDDIRNF